MLKEVAIIHYSAPRKMVGGVELVIDHHSRILTKKGYKVHLIYGAGGGLDYEGLVEHKMSLLAPNNPAIMTAQKEILQKHEATLKFNQIKVEIINYLKESIPKNSTCIVHNINSMPFNFAATAAINEISESLKKVIFWLHDSIILRDEVANVKNKFPYTLLHQKNNPKTIFITPTHYRKKQFNQLPDPYKISGIKVIPNGVSMEEYIKIDDITKLLMRKLKLHFEDYIVLLPVRVTPRKNIELAIKVVNELKYFLPKRRIRLLITGPPDQQASLKGIDYLNFLKSLIRRKNLQDNVIFCSDIIGYSRHIEGDELKKWSVADIYNLADLIFIPSKEEGFGLPIIEAGISRKPIFCSRIPPFEELMKDGIEGDMFGLSEDPKSIAFRIYKEWINDKVDMNFLNVAKRFEWNILVENMLIPII